MRRAIQLCLLLSLFLAILALAFFAAVLLADESRLYDRVQVFLLRLQLRGRSAELDAPFGADADPVRFHIPAGADASAIAASLADANLIRDPGLFVDYARLEGYDRRFEAGLYFLNQRQSIRQIAELLTDSSKSYIPFRSLEGARIEELAALIDDNRRFGFSGADFLPLVAAGAAIPTDFADWAGIPSGASLEGFLFPDTWQLPPTISAENLRDPLLREFQNRVGEDLRDQARQQGWTLYQIVTLASIIEREAVWPAEHPMIASVYHNRLNSGMRLEADPTVQYGLQGARGAWWPPITFADFRGVQSPYNTFLNSGLPPGPIASPSLSAIRAALEPAESGYFFFHAACDDSFYHNFAVTYEEHLQNVC